MAILWILINVMCTVNIRGHEAKFYEAEARCHKAEIETRKNEAEAEWFGLEAMGLEALTSLRFGPLRSDLRFTQWRRKGGGRVSVQGPGRVDCERKLHALLTGRDYQHKNIETLRYAEPKGDQDSTAKVRESYNVLWQRPSSKSAY